MSNSVLLVEDTPSLAMMYASLLEREGHTVETAMTFADGVSAFKRLKPAVALIDLMLPDGDGQDLITHILSEDPSCKIIVITANGSINRAVEAMRAGSFDFLVKPFADKRLTTATLNAMASHQTATGKAISVNTTTNGFHGFIGTSPIMQRIYDKLDNIARSTATVFLTGESGTGKEVCAQTIHDLSSRSKGPFVPLNCGAIPADLLESEVFGHLKGSFTGAIADKIGAAEAADGGTLFLDEICEMDLSLQTKLLRFLQQRGAFREDLYYRLHVVPLHLPPLRERGEDVLEIAREILAKISGEENKRFERLSDEVKAIFRNYEWPGNVRQVINVIRNVVVLNDGPARHHKSLRRLTLPRKATALRSRPLLASGLRMWNAS